MNTIYKTLSALVTAAFVSCSEQTPTRTEQILQPTQELPGLKNDDCSVGKLHEAFYEKIAAHHGYEGVQVLSPAVIETSFLVRTELRLDSSAGRASLTGVKAVNKYIVGHERTKGMYVRVARKTSVPHYFSEEYVPLGDEMACAFAEKLLKVVELARVKVQ